MSVVVDLKYKIIILIGETIPTPPGFKKQHGGDILVKYYKCTPAPDIIIYGKEKTFESSICKQIMMLKHREYNNYSIYNIRDETIRSLGYILMILSKLKLSQYYSAVSYISYKDNRHDIIAPTELFLQELFDIAIFSLRDLNFIKEKKNIRGFINYSVLNAAYKTLDKYGPYYVSNYHTILKYAKHLNRNFKGWFKLRLIYFRDVLNDLLLRNVSDIVLGYFKINFCKITFDDVNFIVDINLENNGIIFNI